MHGTAWRKAKLVCLWQCNSTSVPRANRRTCEIIISSSNLWQFLKSAIRRSVRILLMPQKLLERKNPQVKWTWARTTRLPIIENSHSHLGSACDGGSWLAQAVLPLHLFPYKGKLSSLRLTFSVRGCGEIFLPQMESIWKLYFRKIFGMVVETPGFISMYQVFDFIIWFILNLWTIVIMSLGFWVVSKCDMRLHVVKCQKLWI